MQTPSPSYLVWGRTSLALFSLWCPALKEVVRQWTKEEAKTIVAEVRSLTSAKDVRNDILYHTLVKGQEDIQVL